MRKLIAYGLALFAALFVIGAIHGCALVDAVSPQEAANLSYKAQQSACVDQYTDRASIDKCRDRVKAAWTVDAGVPEAGRTLNFANDNDAGRDGSK